MRLQRRWQRWIQAQRQAYTEWRLRRRRERREAAEARRQRMLEEQAQVQALAKAVLNQLNAAQMEALRAEIRSQLLEEVRGEAMDLARDELAETLAREEERLQDRVARQLHDIEHDVEARIEEGTAKGLREAEQAWEERVTTLRTQRNAARAARDAAEAQLVALIRELLPEDKKVYLHSAGLRRLALHSLNQVLQRHGVVIKARQTYSERQLACELAPARWEQRSVFWLATVLPAGVRDEDDEDVSYTNSGNAYTPGPLALPEGLPPNGGNGPR